MCNYFQFHTSHSQCMCRACVFWMLDLTVTNNARRPASQNRFCDEHREKWKPSAVNVKTECPTYVCTYVSLHSSIFTSDAHLEVLTGRDLKEHLVASKRWQTSDLINTNKTKMPELYSMRHSWEIVLQQQEKSLFKYLNSAFSQNPVKEKRNDLDFFSHWLTVEVCWYGTKSPVDIFHAFTFDLSSHYTEHYYIVLGPRLIIWLIVSHQHKRWVSMS